MSQIIMMPNMKAVEWERDDETMIIVYHTKSKRILKPDNPALLYKDYAFIEMVLTKNNWRYLGECKLSL